LAFTKGHKLATGRPKGSKNKHSFNAEEIANKFDVQPLEILMMIATGDWAGLGYAEKSKISFTSAGIEFEEDHIRLQDRTMAAKEASKYLYSQKQAVALSTGEEGIKIVVEDYSKGK